MRTAVLALVCASCTLQPEDATNEPLAGGSGGASSSVVSSHLFSGHWPLAADVDPGDAPASSPFPAYTMDVLRFWGMDAVQWGVLEPTRTQFNFANLDHAMAVAQQHGVTQFEYTFGMVPHWANAGAVDALAAGFTSYCLWDGSHYATTHADPVGLQPVLFEHLE